MVDIFFRGIMDFRDTLILCVLILLFVNFPFGVISRIFYRTIFRILQHYSRHGQYELCVLRLINIKSRVEKKMSSGSSALYDLAIFEPNYISFLKIHGYSEILKV